MSEDKTMNTEQIPQDIIADLQKVGFQRINDHSCTFKQAMVDFARLREQAALQAKSVPDVLFDGYAVYKALTKQEQSRTSWENVSDVLNAVVRLLKLNPAPQPPVPQGTDDDRVRELEARIDEQGSHNEPIR